MSFTRRNGPGGSGAESSSDVGAAVGKRTLAEQLRRRPSNPQRPDGGAATVATADHTGSEATEARAAGPAALLGRDGPGATHADTEAASSTPAVNAAGDASGSTLPAASGANLSTIEGQLEALGGVRIALARQAADSDIAHDASTLLHPRSGPPRTRAQVLASLRGRIGNSSQFALVGTLPSSGLLTAADATALATALRHNNAEFMNQGPRAALAHHTVGGAPSAPTIDRVIPFLRTQDPLALVEAMSVAVRDGASIATADPTPTEPGAAPVAASVDGRRRERHVVPRTQNIVELSIFTHGIPDAIELGSLGWAGAATVASRLSPLLAPNVRINLYACEAASGDDSFAEQLTEGLARDAANPHTVDTFGHTTYGNTATLTMGRQLHAGAGAGAEATSETNWQFFFTQVYLRAQADELVPLLTEAAHPPTASQVFDTIRDDGCGVAWLVNRLGAAGGPDGSALNRVRVTMPSGEQLVASFAVGLEPALTLAAVRARWVAERLPLVLHHLPRHMPRIPV